MTSKQTEMKEGAPPYITPKSKEEFERNLLRKMSDIMKHWRNCRVPKCRRSRGCASSRLSCLRRNPAPAPAQEWGPHRGAASPRHSTAAAGVVE